MKYFKTYATYINEELSGHAKKMKEDGLSDDEIKKMHPEVTDEDLNEAKKFKAGDMWSKTFDYGGMLAAGLKVNVNTPIGELNKLFDSFTDVNYHREAKDLLDAIDKIESGDKKAASKHIDMFHKACKETLKTNEASNVMKDLEKIGGQIDYLSDADDATKKIWKKAGVNPEDDNGDHPTIILYSYVNSWPETKKLLDKSKIKYKELEDPNSAGESFIVFNESVNEAKFNKKKLMKAMKKDDGLIMTSGGGEYVIYKFGNGNSDNDEAWQDDFIFAVDQDGEDHEIEYSDIVSYNESVINENDAKTIVKAFMKTYNKRDEITASDWEQFIYDWTVMGDGGNELDSEIEYDTVDDVLTMLDKKGYKKLDDEGIIGLYESYESTINEEYIELMQIDKPLEDLKAAWEQWRSGPATNYEDVPPAFKELQKYVTKWLKKNLR